MVSHWDNPRNRYTAPTCQGMQPSDRNCTETSRNIGLLWQVELREEVAAGKAALEAQTRAASHANAELNVTRRKLHEATSALAESNTRSAALTAEAAALKKAVEREQVEVARLQGVAKVAKEEAIRAKQWREAQVTVNNDKLQEQQEKASQMQRKANRSQAELAKTIERLRARSPPPLPNLPKCAFLVAFELEVTGEIPDTSFRQLKSLKHNQVLHRTQPHSPM